MGLCAADIHTHAFLSLLSSYCFFWATEPAGDNNASSSLPSALNCRAVTICGNWLGSKLHVTRPKDPETNNHMHTCGSYSCDREVAVKRAERLFIVHLDTHRQGGTKWHNVPGRKYTWSRVKETAAKKSSCREAFLRKEGERKVMNCGVQPFLAFAIKHSVWQLREGMSNCSRRKCISVELSGRMKQICV